MTMPKQHVNVIDFRLARNVRSAIGVFYNAIVSESKGTDDVLVIDVRMPDEVMALAAPDRRQAMMNLAGQAYSAKKADKPIYTNSHPEPIPLGLSGYIPHESGEPESTIMRMELTGAAKSWIDELNRQRDKETVAETELSYSPAGRCR